MTRGHFHQRREQGEVYFGIRGSGLLLLQNERGEARLEQVSPGSVHIIPGNTAHRLINTGTEILSALAVWPTIAGHDYLSLAGGFALRVTGHEGKIQAKEVQNG
jgi:glucose-6-phosphate isomerase